MMAGEALRSRRTRMRCHMAEADLYETDPVAWAEGQGAALRPAAAAASDLPIDFEHLAEEVEEFADRRRDALEAALTRTIEQLLKLEHSPATAPGQQWLLSVAEHRVRAQTLTED